MVSMDRKQSFHSFSVPMNRDLRGILSLKPYMSFESDKIRPFKGSPLSMFIFGSDPIVRSFVR